MPRTDSFANHCARQVGPLIATQRVVLATRNMGKIEEFRRILSENAVDSIELLGLSEFPAMPEVEETGVTFRENALLKARAISLATGLPAISDDSGLCIDALGGAPGIFSARWAGIHGDDLANMEKVLAELGEIPFAERTAHFTCVAALVIPNDIEGIEEIEEGFLFGHILNGAVGNFGFGYDPIFQPLGEQRSLGEMAPRYKDEISHRGQALRALAPRAAEMLRGLR